MGHPSLEKSEWCFTDRTTLPDWQCRFCANYEYARENKAFVRSVKSRPRPERQLHKGHVWVLQDFLAESMPEFPDTPWLKIPAERRSELLSTIGISATPSGLVGIRIWEGPDEYCQHVNEGRIIGCLDPDASFVIEVDFSEHPTLLMKQFAIWLRAKRKELTEKFPGHPSYYAASRVRKGQGSNVRVWSNYLNLLGYYRKNKWRHIRPQAMREREQRQRKKVEELIARFVAMRKIGFVL